MTSRAAASSNSSPKANSARPPSSTPPPPTVAGSGQRGVTSVRVYGETILVSDVVNYGLYSRPSAAAEIFYVDSAPASR